MLEEHAKLIKDVWLEQSQIVRCAKAMIYCKLGVNYYDAEEVSESARQHEKAKKAISDISKGLTIRFCVCI